jgi:hypothetical protein
MTPFGIPICLVTDIIDNICLKQTIDRCCINHRFYMLIIISIHQSPSLNLPFMCLLHVKLLIDDQTQNQFRVLVLTFELISMIVRTPMKSRDDVYSR